MSERVDERIRKLRAEIEKGLAEAKAGRFVDGPTVFAKLQARLRHEAKEDDRTKSKRRQR
jgi:predicted transcriptional regulator